MTIVWECGPLKVFRRSPHSGYGVRPTWLVQFDGYTIDKPETKKQAIATARRLATETCDGWQPSMEEE